MKRYVTITLAIFAFIPITCIGDNPDFKTVDGGALYLTRSGYETHRAEFLIAGDCEHAARIMNKAEPLVDWHCSTSMPDIKFDCEIAGFSLDPETEAETGFNPPKSLEMTLVLNRGLARGDSDLGVPLDFEYTEGESGYLLTSNYPYASGNYFTQAVYLLIIDSKSGLVEVRDIGGKTNGSGKCEEVE